MQYEKQIDKGLTQSTVNAPLEAEQNLITEEIMIRCMQGMLLFFDSNFISPLFLVEFLRYQVMKSC